VTVLVYWCKSAVDESKIRQRGKAGNLNGSPDVREASCQATFTLTHRSRSTAGAMQPMSGGVGAMAISASLATARGPSRSRSLSRSAGLCFAKTTGCV